MPRKAANPPPPRPALGARIATLRKAAGLTQKELAEAVGASQQSVAFWEKNARPPRADTLVKVAAALGVRLEDVLDESADKVAAGQLPHHGPAGLVVKTFEEVRALPRHQQIKVVELVQVLLEQYKKRASLTPARNTPPARRVACACSPRPPR